MTMFKREWAAALAAFAAVACGGSSGPSPQTLAGTWGATKAELVKASNSATRVDVVAKGGTVQLVLRDDKSFDLTISEPGKPVEQTSGTWSSSSDVLSLSFTFGSISGRMEFDMSLSGGTLSLSGADTGYDFDDDGVEEPAKVNLTMVKKT